jgi:tRNA-5-methyluridine54 2-sulfurtransferase
MQCIKCDQPPVIELQHGNLCKIHFVNYFEDKVFKTINKYNLIQRSDKLCIATSGGKDSLTVLYLTKKYCEKNNIKTSLFALVIDEGINNYRKKTMDDLKKFCKEHDIQLKCSSFKGDFKKTLDQAYPIINQGTKKKPCNVCGVWRRYLLNKYSKIHGANKIVTGHNLDDEAQAIIMNLFKANTQLTGRLGPISGTHQHDLFIQRVKPLYFCTDKEVKLYSLLKGFQVQFTECPYSHEGYRYQIQEMLNNFENKFKGTKQGIVKSFLALPKIEEEIKKIKQCIKCDQAANQKICNACKMSEVIQNEIS